MRVVAFEEHFTIPSLMHRIDPQAIAHRGFPLGFGAALEKALADIGTQRIADMDQAGITMHVLSIAGPWCRSGRRPRGRCARHQRSREVLFRGPDQPIAVVVLITGKI
jgi:hypothetical protein